MCRTLLNGWPQTLPRPWKPISLDSWFRGSWDCSWRDSRRRRCEVWCNVWCSSRWVHWSRGRWQCLPKLSSCLKRGPEFPWAFRIKFLATTVFCIFHLTCFLVAVYLFKCIHSVSSPVLQTFYKSYSDSWSFVFFLVPYLRNTSLFLYKVLCRRNLYYGTGPLNNFQKLNLRHMKINDCNLGQPGSYNVGLGSHLAWSCSW